MIKDHPRIYSERQNIFIKYKKSSPVIATLYPNISMWTARRIAVALNEVVGMTVEETEHSNIVVHALIEIPAGMDNAISKEYILRGTSVQLVLPNSIVDIAYINENLFSAKYSAAKAKAIGRRIVAALNFIRGRHVSELNTGD